jgi:ferredoxin--NADP+ reductase
MHDRSEPCYNAVVLQKEELSPRLMILRVSADGWGLPAFIAGQYTVLGLPGSAPRCDLSLPEAEPSEPDEWILRAYSIASSSVIHEYLEFYINLVSSGALTPRLFALTVGDRLWLSDKVTGLFTLDQVPKGRNVIFIATGTGLAPYMSMLTSHLDCNGPRRFAVLHGAYHSWDLGYRSELLALQNICHNVSYIATIDRPEEEPILWSGHVGWVQGLWRDHVVDGRWGFEPNPDNCDIFLCGHPAMIAEMSEILEREGFSEHSRRHPGQIHIERF